ncbi:tRNA/tmRNA/rRNA uracil-C5-methylase (TrmA/RlmC/RlmD family) [Breznakia sp. PF5-3]|uniref:hypothetical protein n=1 Tax=unclassified Breznakia TaxID=2623764 RepID=UPI0024070D89|nr:MULTISPECIES: hypothetical protein [unclassified Breznakia]MDF9824161.1 tRNA/tmRNA/rRNA uracil-C5-methylase (TrmA/RlmC/RlmD family) [Breznakia sp. PM6-1]MDF9834959.1 tRNA/tmRNA/rRNA uracil-C5-methylase (TrmA/RlmC/RlmD family) [Breznakia sp. PF5-3]MDF9837172.1 tRNA/tmRNA/rRNA uracil-C5-methylase (TrmA/RlmC/RlmD family) [Breznakia sp. PFB2-8]MDF9859162.1 tRNA/tmRNA/rRNA uracil-C5-methylase (TrmA/RlmC/RlmD family) [Breznakia sp. PH5-24]
MSSLNILKSIKKLNIFGKGYFYDTLCGLTFKIISPKSFYQINHEQCEKLYDKALSLLELKGDEVIVDTYCGIRTISLLAAQKTKVYLYSFVFLEIISERTTRN